jgi:hypothetical protein
MVISSKYELIPYSNPSQLVNPPGEATLGIRSVRATQLENRHDPLRRPQPFSEYKPPASNKSVYNSQQRTEFSRLNQMGRLIDIYV